MFEHVSELAGRLSAQAIADLPDAHIQEDFERLHRLMQQLEAERLRRLAEIDRRATYARDGHLSSASWLAATHNVARGSAAAQVRLATALSSMGETGAAFARGELSMSAVQVLAMAHDVDNDAFGRAETVLLDAARHLSVADLQKAVGRWRERVRRDACGTDLLREGRRLHVSTTFGGMVRLDGDLDPETGETVLTALRAVMDADARATTDDDTRRTAAQQRADALGEICRDWLDLAERPAVAGERPHLTVTVDVQDLVGDGPGELSQAGVVSAHALRRLGCDASVVRVVMAGRSAALDVGRRTPVVSPAIRRAVVVRDRCCTFPGCDRPQAWCDAHHVVHWADGGMTSVDNLLLLCRRHHRVVHEGFEVQMHHGRPRFSRPDGSPLEDRAPPRMAA